MFRTRDTPDPAERAIVQAIHELDPSQPPPAFKSMDRALAEAVAPRKFVFVLLGLFAALAALLAVIGLYGVLAHLVTEQTREIGIRAALGADAGQLARHVLHQGLVIVGMGTMIGLVLAAVSVRAVRSMLYDVDPHDPRTFVAVAALLAVTSALACYLPARRASRVDPMVALRAE